MNGNLKFENGFAFSNLPIVRQVFKLTHSQINLGLPGTKADRIQQAIDLPPIFLRSYLLLHFQFH